MLDILPKCQQLHYFSLYIFSIFHIFYNFEHVYFLNKNKNIILKEFYHVILNELKYQDEQYLSIIVK